MSLVPLTANFLLGVRGRIAIRLAVRVFNNVTGRSVQYINKFLFYCFMWHVCNVVGFYSLFVRADAIGDAIMHFLNLTDTSMDYPAST
jgi:hypothetical protein